MRVKQQIKWKQLGNCKCVILISSFWCDKYSTCTSVRVECHELQFITLLQKNIKQLSGLHQTKWNSCLQLWHRMRKFYDLDYCTSHAFECKVTLSSYGYFSTWLHLGDNLISEWSFKRNTFVWLQKEIWCNFLSQSLALHHFIQFKVTKTNQQIYHFNSSERFVTSWKRL